MKDYDIRVGLQRLSDGAIGVIVGGTANALRHARWSQLREKVMVKPTIVLFAVLMIAACSSPTKSNDGSEQSDGCEALQVGVAMECANSCGGLAPGTAARASVDLGFRPGPTDAGIQDAGNAPPAPDFGNDPPPPDDMGSFPTDVDAPPDAGSEPDSGFVYADFCELTLNADGSTSEWHGDYEEVGSWSCSDGILRVDSDSGGPASYVLKDDGCLQGSVYNFK